MTKKTTNKKSSSKIMNKLSSRKFQVWLVWTVITVVSLFIIQLESEVKSQIVQFYGWVSLIYVGGNVAQKYITNKPNTTTTINDDNDIK